LRRSGETTLIRKVRENMAGEMEEREGGGGEMVVVLLSANVEFRAR
jgi:hypothetical protein